MTSHPQQPSSPYRVRLVKLMQHFSRMSSGPNQWIARPVAGFFVSAEGRVVRYIIAAFSNPEPSNLPNPLIYAVPITIRQSEGGTESDLIVCLDPAMVVPLSKGLYLDGNELHYNESEDWDRFWRPMEEDLSQPLEDMNWEQQRLLGESPAGRRKTLDGAPHLATLSAYVKWWANAKDQVQNLAKW
jgi:hypothetical protein